jgi:Cu+-exporting ATPase
MLRIQPGIHSVKVALLAERGVVEFDPLQWNVVKVINVSISSSLGMLSEPRA